MTEATPSTLGLPSVRTLEWLAGTDLLAGPAAASTSQLAGLGPVASVVETATVGDDATGGGGPLPEVVAEAANRLVLDTHARLEETGHDVPALNGPLHGLTSFGETVGFGHLNTPGNLVTDTAALALGGEATSIPAYFANAARVTDAAGTLAVSATEAVGSEAGGGPIGSGGLLSPVASVLNQGVLGFHAQLEETGHQNPPLNGPIHGLTNLGETLGLGHLGTPGNLLTDAAALPGAVLAGGGLGAVNPILQGLGEVTDAGGNLVSQVVPPASAGGLLSATGLLAPVADVANGAVLDLHATLEQAGHDVPALNGTVHGVTGLGETLGLGHLGESGNLLTDVVNLPGGLLGGEGTAAFAPVLSDVGDVLGSVGNLTGAVTGTLGAGGGGLLQPVGDILDGATGGPGEGGVLQPVTDILDGVGGGGNGGDGNGGILQPVTDLLGGATGGAGAGGILQPVTDVLDGVTGGSGNGGLLQPVTDILGGAGEAGGDGGAGGILQPVTGLLDGVTGGGAGGGVPGQVVETVGGLLGNGGAEGGTGGGLPGGALGGVLEGALGGLTSATGPGEGSGGTGSAPLVDVGVGPQGGDAILDTNLLSSGTGGGQPIQVSALDSDSGTPLLGTSLLSGDGIAFPQSSGGGLDALVGGVLDLPKAVTATAAQADPGLHLDLGVAALDLGGHADAHVADTQHHAPNSGLHLLGL